jgi:hypothetical protein
MSATFADIPAGAEIFVDANTFVYAYADFDRVPGITRYSPA